MAAMCPGQLCVVGAGVGAFVGSSIVIVLLF